MVLECGGKFSPHSNMLSASVGTRPLASYSYNPYNGTLKNMSYGQPSLPTAVVSYEYDKLDRVKKVTYDDYKSGDETVYGYRYSADGSLAGITENEELRYTYEYDSLGRLIYSSRLENGNTVLYTKHRYDTSNRITGQDWQIGNSSFSESYTYNQKDGTLATMSTGGDTLGFTYNYLKQRAKRTSPKMDITYSHHVRDVDGKVTTNRISALYFYKHGTEEQLLPKLLYSYDALGNITKVTSGSTTEAQYTYDEQNQLTREVLSGRTGTYSCDTYGNIRSKTSTFSNGTSESLTYTYGSNNWLDLLTRVTFTNTSGTSTSGDITYDAIGNPLSYFNGKKTWTFTWKNGRQLASAVSGNTTVTNTYDVDGIRESKTVGGVKHEYVTLDGKIVRESHGTTTIDYFYDNDGRPYKLVVDENGSKCTGYFVLNQQGDTIALLNSNGTVVVEYEYDAWGKEIGHTALMSNGATLYAHNALKYRGYYYDAETGFYYVSSRYYDPEIGRFINADNAISGTGGDILGYNMFV